MFWCCLLFESWIRSEPRREWFACHMQLRADDLVFEHVWSFRLCALADLSATLLVEPKLRRRRLNRQLQLRRSKAGCTYCAC